MKYVIVVLALLSSLVCVQAGGSKPYKLMILDYTLNDSGIRPISIGVCSWSNDDQPLTGGCYLDIAFLSLLDDRLRLGAGLLVAHGDDRLDVKLHTSVTTLVWDWLEVGVYYAPFWGMAQELGDDPPYGVMIGYAIKL